jgi:predicted CopG family antitoxin
MSTITKKATSAILEAPVVWKNLDVDRLETSRLEDYQKVVQECRFFYRSDPIASTVINKLVEIGITDLELDLSSFPQNDRKIYEAYLGEINKFLRLCGLEYLITGLVVPEITFEPVDRVAIRSFGIKKYMRLYFPVSMWIRNSEHIKINSSFISNDKPSYSLMIPDDLIMFIRSKGTYPDGTIDKERYQWLEKNFPDFVRDVLNGKREILLNNELIVRGRYLPDSPYPIPYLYPALDSLKHKRNMRRMDYALAARVIAAIQHIKVGNDTYPLLEGEEEEIFSNIRNQLRYKNAGDSNIERIVQLFTNHTVEISWVIPQIDVLLSSSKYEEVNNDIFFALGFPRILTTGETLRTQASNHELATKSPIKTMETMQKDLLPIAKYIVNQIGILNNLTTIPKVKFGSIDFYSFSDFVRGLFELRKEGGISLESLGRVFGLDYDEEKRKMQQEAN